TSRVLPRGFVRADGLPFADTVSELFDIGRIFYPIVYDENGRLLDPAVIGGFFNTVWSGTNPDGTAQGNDCATWTATTLQSQAVVGKLGSGPAAWQGLFEGCDATNRIFCFGIDKTTPLAASAAASGKKIWVTNSVFNTSSGLAGAQMLCDTERPLGVATARVV